LDRQANWKAGKLVSWLAAHVPCFSFINSTANSFIKLSAAIIYARLCLLQPVNSVSAVHVQEQQIF